jgi:hypothetical protein
MAKKSEFGVRPNDEWGGGERTEGSLIKKDNNIEGIFMALRYLSLEAEGAGLIELATMLEEAALKWDRSTTKRSNNSKRFNKSRAAPIKADSHKSRQVHARAQDAQCKTERA